MIIGHLPLGHLPCTHLNVSPSGESFADRLFKAVVLLAAPRRLGGKRFLTQG